MKLIIPMAGMGKRLRPHTLITPKPLLKIAGKSIVERLVQDLNESNDEPFSEVHFVIGRFGSEVEKNLISIAESYGSKGFIHYQDEALGTAHAIYCAKSALEGELIVAFADTLFNGSFTFDRNNDGVIWTMEVSNPENYGVVVTDDEGTITDFVEKPKDGISNNAIIGIYYFKEGHRLRNEIQVLIDGNLRENNEFQLTNCLETLKIKGTRFRCAVIDEWLDCGNKGEIIRTHARYIKNKGFQSSTEDVNVKIINPVYLGPNVVLKNCVVGPYVSIEENTEISDSEISNSIVYSNTKIRNAKLKDSMIGKNCDLNNIEGVIDVGDFSRYEK